MATTRGKDGVTVHLDDSEQDYPEQAPHDGTYLVDDDGNPIDDGDSSDRAMWLRQDREAEKASNAYSTGEVPTDEDVDRALGTIASVVIGEDEAQEGGFALRDGLIVPDEVPIRGFSDPTAEEDAAHDAMNAVGGE